MKKYLGTPYFDKKFNKAPQEIPGKVYLAYYDLGGEGIAYHDVDAVNHGSGELNPVNGSYLHSFRINEGVDTTYTKRVGDCDCHEFNKYEVPLDMLYVGWTEVGEWVKCSVNIRKTGVYKLKLLCTAIHGGVIGLEIDDVLIGKATLPPTYNALDPLAWRQWHHWQEVEIMTITLQEGIHCLTLKTLEVGQMNYAYIEFILL